MDQILKPQSLKNKNKKKHIHYYSSPPILRLSENHTNQVLKGGGLKMGGNLQGLYSSPAFKNRS